jgi:hypothetical protein
VIFRPSASIAIANCFASISVGNDFDSLVRGTGEEKRRKRRCFGVSTETNQWLVIDLYLAMTEAAAALGDANNVMRELFDNDPGRLRPEWGGGRKRAIATAK